MNKKIILLLGVMIMLPSGMYAQRPLKMAKITEAMTGGVPSAFSREAAVSVLNAEMIGRHVAGIEFALQNNKYLSSAQLFEKVAPASRDISRLPAVERKALEVKFSQLDWTVNSYDNKNLGYVGALWRTAPTATAATLETPHVQLMAGLLDVQRYMKTHKNMFPQIFSVSERGWLQTTDCLVSPDGSRAFLGVVDILVKEQTQRVPQAVVKQLVALHASAPNVVPVEQVAKQLQAWRDATGLTDSAPKLPAAIEGISLRNNPEGLWLATEIRLWQLTPDVELPETIKNASVIY